MDFDFLGRDDRPAAFRLDPAHGGECARMGVAHAVAVWHLVEAVARRLGADLDGLEQNVVAGIAGHGGLRVS